MKTELIIEFLSQDTCLHIDMIDALQKGNADILAASEQGVLLFNTAGKCYMMTASDQDTADTMIDMLQKTDLITAHQSFYIPKLLNKFKFKNRMDCRQAVYFSNHILSLNLPSIRIKQLEHSHLPVVVKHYEHIPDESFINERIETGMFGAFYQNELCGFVGMHGEGSIGLLTVLPQYRRRGIACALESFMINRILSQGFTPFAQVEVHNTASLKLQEKLNLSISDKVLTWLY